MYWMNNTCDDMEYEETPISTVLIIMIYNLRVGGRCSIEELASCYVETNQAKAGMLERREFR